MDAAMVDRINAGLRERARMPKIAMADPIDGVEQVELREFDEAGNVSITIRAAAPGEITDRMRESYRYMASLRTRSEEAIRARAEQEKEIRRLTIAAHLLRCRENMVRRFAPFGRFSHTGAWIFPGFYYETRLYSEGPGYFGYLFGSTRVFRWKSVPSDEKLLRDTRPSLLKVAEQA